LTVTVQLANSHQNVHNYTTDVLGIKIKEISEKLQKKNLENTYNKFLFVGDVSGIVIFGEVLNLLLNSTRF
jgi:hypothetical protein